jgi:RNA polymerase sigma-70 factor (ECF subfamily)
MRAEGMEENGQEFLEAALPHLDVLYRVARHAGHDHHRAEDVVQETYLRAYAAFASHRGPSTRAWLVAICLNVVRSDGRRRARRVAESPFPEADIYPAGGRNVDDEALAGMDAERVGRALSRLPEPQRLAIVLMDLAGLTAAEVAAQLHCSRNTVLSRVHRGRRRLASLLSREEADRDV